jgi:acyl-CoA hydrolase
MKLTDEVAALAAIKHARTRVVTVGMDRSRSTWARW